MAWKFKLLEFKRNWQSSFLAWKFKLLGIKNGMHFRHFKWNFSSFLKKEFWREKFKFWDTFWLDSKTNMMTQQWVLSTWWYTSNARRCTACMLILISHGFADKPISPRHVRQNFQEGKVGNRSFLGGWMMRLQVPSSQHETVVVATATITLLLLPHIIMNRVKMSTSQLRWFFK